MIPIILGAGALIGAGVAAYKYFSEDDSSPAQGSTPAESPRAIGKFAIWGRPNAGKTTFIRRLIGLPLASSKEATTARRNYGLTMVDANKRKYTIAGITDMPGTQDRLEDWLELVKTYEHVFYVMNLSNTEPGHIAAVRSDIQKTVQALKESGKSRKRLNIIATHVDQSSLRDADPAEITNLLHGNEEFAVTYESKGDRPGYVYAANLVNDDSWRSLISSILADIDA